MGTEDNLPKVLGEKIVVPLNEKDNNTVCFHCLINVWPKYTH